MKLPSKSDLPDEIVEKDKWILWFAEEREGEQTRVPCAPWETDHWGATDATDPDNWTDFDTAAEYADKKEGYGVGFVFSEDDDVVGIDLDDCIKGGKSRALRRLLSRKQTPIPRSRPRVTVPTCFSRESC